MKLLGREGSLAAVVANAADEDQWSTIRLICRRFRCGLLAHEEASEILKMLGLVSPGYVWISPPSSDGHRRKISLEDYEEMLREREKKASVASVSPLPDDPRIEQAAEVQIAIDLLRAGQPYAEEAS